MVMSLPFLACALLARSGLGSLCDPEYASALARAGALHRAWHYEAAIRAYEEALVRDASGFHTLVGLADSWNDRGQAQSGAAAEDAFHRALGHAQCLDEAFPGRPEGPSWAAASYGNLTARGSPGEKLALSRRIAKEARRALLRDPDHPPALVALGIYERELASLGFFARAAARTLLGGLEETSLEESERLLRRALDREPASLLARHELALTLLAAKKDDEATAALRRVLEIAPKEVADVARQLDAAARLTRLPQHLHDRSGPSAVAIPDHSRGRGILRANDPP